MGINNTKIMISLIIPSYNNLQHLKNVYASIRKNAPQAKMMFLDDGSTDGTYEWLMSLPKDNLYHPYRSEERVGHTILYDKGISLVDDEIVGILHADMIVGPNYIENLLKHLKPGKVVCGTRIEPPLHPPGKEKIIMNFGLDFDTLNINAFEKYVLEAQNEFKDQTTKGMFAPWIIYKKDFQVIGGHDPLFAPFPYEDSDIFQRWILAGYELIQSRDAFVYHLTCRGHRWNEQVGKDDNYYKIVSQRAARNYLRKWGSWIKNDEFQHPIIPHKYNIAFVVKHCNLQLLEVLEPWCDRIYIEDEMQVLTDSYIEKEQSNTKYDLKKRVLTIEHNYPEGENDIVLEFDARMFTQNSFNIIQNLSDIITESGEVGIFELDCFKVTINNLETYEKNLIINLN
jgi:glycosyltransferase involved in cell wall biosynthesis